MELPSKYGNTKNTEKCNKQKILLGLRLNLIIDTKIIGRAVSHEWCSQANPSLLGDCWGTTRKLGHTFEILYIFVIVNANYNRHYYLKIDLNNLQPSKKLLSVIYD